MAVAVVEEVVFVGLRDDKHSGSGEGLDQLARVDDRIDRHHTIGHYQGEDRAAQECACVWGRGWMDE